MNKACAKSETNRGKRFSLKSIITQNPFVNEENKIPEELYKGAESWRRDIHKLSPVIKINNKKENKLGHTAPFPLAIPEMSIQYYSYKGDVVLDMFAGSFTVAIAAQKLGRIGVGFELRQDLFRDSIIKNLDNHECSYEEVIENSLINKIENKIISNEKKHIYMNIYDYLNKREILKNMSDEEFETFLPKFCEALENYTFKQILIDYNDKLTDNNKDWNNLKGKKIDKNNISSTSVVGANIIKRNMPHIYDVKNHKGKCISDLWNIEILKKVIRVNRKTHSTPYVSEIIRQIGFVAGSSKVTIYRPLLTKRIVQYFNAKNILDVCIGWGGRMLGSVCVDGVSYTGIEPYSKTFMSLEKI